MFEGHHNHQRLRCILPTAVAETGEALLQVTGMVSLMCGLAWVCRKAAAQQHVNDRHDRGIRQVCGKHIRQA